jgi:hypothetical protein
VQTQQPVNNVKLRNHCKNSKLKIGTFVNLENKESMISRKSVVPLVTMVRDPIPSREEDTRTQRLQNPDLK